MARSAGPKIIELETEQARINTQIKQLEARKAGAEVEISLEALALVLDVWLQQIHEAQKNQDIRALRYIRKRFESKIELDYNQAKIWYTYLLDRLETLESNHIRWGHTLKKNVLRKM